MEQIVAPRGIKVSYYDPSQCKEIVRPIHTFEEICTLLHEIAKQRVGKLATGAQLLDQDGSIFSIGLDDGGWLLMHDDAEHTCISFSVGDVNAKGNVGIFFHQEEHLPKQYLLPIDDSIRAINYWFLTGKLSDSIKWDVNMY